MMPSRGRFPPYLVLLVLAFMFVGLVGFQIVKERRVSVAALSDKEFQLESVVTKLQEQVKVTREREEERDFIQTKVTELERVSKSAKDILRTREQELENLKKLHDQTVHELEQLKRVVVQKDGEIVHVRAELNQYSFQKAKESAEQITNQAAPVVPDRQDEFKHADEAGLGDRTRIQEEEDRQTTEKEHVSATEQEMFERSQRKDEFGKIALGEDGNNEADEKIDESSKEDSLRDEEAEEQDNADTRDPDEKENDGTQDDDGNDGSKFRAELHSSDHEEVGLQVADQSVE